MICGRLLGSLWGWNFLQKRKLEQWPVFPNDSSVAHYADQGVEPRAPLVQGVSGTPLFEDLSSGPFYGQGRLNPERLQFMVLRELA